ncbi:unnamed protein product, partial [Amoebophrya sp. A120]
CKGQENYGPPLENGTAYISRYSISIFALCSYLLLPCNHPILLLRSVSTEPVHHSATYSRFTLTY